MHSTLALPPSRVYPIVGQLFRSHSATLQICYVTRSNVSTSISKLLPLCSDSISSATFLQSAVPWEKHQQLPSNFPANPVEAIRTRCTRCKSGGVHFRNRPASARSRIHPSAPFHPRSTLMDGGDSRLIICKHARRQLADLNFWLSLRAFIFVKIRMV
jgi:hypothetical protein